MDIAKILKTPSNTDELKQVYKDNGLVYYTPKEELFHSLSHGLGAVAALIFMIFMLLKSSTPAEYATAVFSLSPVFIPFFGFAILHRGAGIKM